MVIMKLDSLFKGLR